MREQRRGFRARLAQVLTGLGGRRKRKGKISKEARLQDRPWGSQSCPDLAQGQGSTNDVSLKGASPQGDKEDGRDSWVAGPS
uniref:Crystallin beta-gamma domain containing 2 n=1 Tax=Mus musculus TaxID=10090 RepID=A0A1W2P8A2_MOUSE